MSGVFLKLLNMSITAGWLILAVVIIRPLLKKSPKWINCVLWALVALRLVCPFSFESALSLIPSSETIPHDIAMQDVPAIETGISSVNQVINPIIADSFTPNPLNSANPLQIVIPVASIVWLTGMVLLLAYALFSYLRLKKIVGASILLKDDIMVCDDVKSPFILGIFKPVIYVPSSMSGETLNCVLIHEKAHIKRHDHWWKPLGYLLLTVYWFNPLCWLAYILLCRDIEMACDEKVVRDMDRNQKAAYSQALLNCSFSRRRIAACPLAFGEVGVKERVKSVLNYKKPAFWIVVAAVIACVVVAVCFLTNPKRDSFEVRIVVPAHGQNRFYYSEEQISPTRNRIILNAGANIVDTEVVLKTIEVKEENSYEPVYLTHGMPVKMDVEKGAWFSVGVYMDNPADEDIIVSVIVDNVSVRIADAAAAPTPTEPDYLQQIEAFASNWDKLHTSLYEAPFNEWFAVVDINHDGILELLVSDRFGTGHYSYNGIYRAIDGGIQEIKNNLQLANGEPDLITEWVDMYRDPDSGTEYYVWRDDLRLYAGEYYQTYGGVHLSEDLSSLENDLIGTEHILYEPEKHEYFDADNKELSQSDFENLIQNYYVNKGYEHHEVHLSWREKKKASEYAGEDEIIAELIDSYQGFQAVNRRY